MLVSITKPLNIKSFNCSLIQNLKNLSTSAHLRQTNSSESSAYDGSGKTTVRVINNEDSHLNIVNSYAENGFRLANNLFVTGSMILFPTHVFSWSIKRGRDITPESLRLFDLIVPKVKILVIGYGHEDEPHDSSLPFQLKKRGMSCELLPTPRALSTYNFLLSDAVHVAGAFVTYNKDVCASDSDNLVLEGYDFLNRGLMSNQDTSEKDTYKYYKPLMDKQKGEREDDDAKR